MKAWLWLCVVLWGNFAGDQPELGCLREAFETTFSHRAVLAQCVLVYGDQEVNGDVTL